MRYAQARAPLPYTPRCRGRSWRSHIGEVSASASTSKPAASCAKPHRRAFAGYLSEDLGFSLELVQKASPPEIRVGSGFRHYTVAVPSIEAAISRATERGLGIVEGTRFEQGEVYIRVRASATAVCAVALSSCAAHALLRPGLVPQPPLN